VENLALEGYNVLLNYNKSEKSAKELKEKLAKKNIKIEIYKADISKKEEVDKLISYAISKFKNIDVLVNNAGIARLQMFQDISVEDWREMLDTNLNSVFYTSQAVLKNMIHNKKRMHYKYFFNMGNNRSFL
jgi:3-oxoacyl-[acyl-carrier protein] reductase